MDFTSNIAYNLTEDDFEKLSNLLAARIEGNEVISFAKGTDGGKDGRRIGYSKDIDKWKASGSKFIIQAKHTANPMASCSDNKFHGNKTSIVAEEIDKIKRLNANNELNYYILFTNRKYTGNADSIIRKAISEETSIDVDNIEIIGIETINELLNKESNKDIVSQFKLNNFHIPFDFSDKEMKEIILAFKQQLPSISSDIKQEVDKLKYDFSHINKDKKNEKNKLSEDHYQNNILSKSLMEFDKIEQFLNNPVNEELKNYYFDTAHELNQIISKKRDEYEAFEELFLHIYQLICDGSVLLMGGKRHVITFLHYMYVECEIGKK